MSEDSLGKRVWGTKRAAFVSLPVVALVTVGSVVAVQGSDPALTLTAQVAEGAVSKMVTAKGVVSAAKTANLSFKTANNITQVDVKVGDKVKKGQRLGVLDNGTLRQQLLVAEGTLAQQQAALDLILNDVNPAGLAKIADRAQDVADQAKKNIDIREAADLKAYHRLQGVVQFDAGAVRSALAALDRDGCTRDGGTRPQQFPAPAANVAPVPGPGVQSLTPFGVPTRPVFPNDPDQTTAPQATCRADFAALQTARKTYFSDRTAFINAKKNLAVNRGVLRSTWRSALQALDTARNTANIARVNRPNQILAQRALVANAQSAVVQAQSGLKNSYVYAPIDGTVTAIDGTVGEFTAGGNNLTPNTPTGPGATAKIPTVGGPAAADQKNLTGGQAPNLGLQAVLPGGQAFMQLSDLNAFQVVAAYPEADAAQITPGSLAKVGFDALPGKDVDGTVTAVMPIGASVNGVTTYYATVLLNSAPAQLKSGMAANVNVTVANVENKAFVVPTSAVTASSGDQATVYVPGADGKPEKRTFTKGAVGDDNTQVMNGLKPGDTVLVPETGRLPRASDDAPDAPSAMAGNSMPVVLNSNYNPRPAQPVNPAAAPAVPMPGIGGSADPTAGMGLDPTLGADPTLDDPSLAGDPGAGADPAGAPAGPGN